LVMVMLSPQVWEISQGHKKEGVCWARHPQSIDGVQKSS
jgi:hypothetical protein